MRPYDQLFARNMGDTFFNFDNYDIRADGRESLTADAQFLSQHPSIEFLIQGHCDERGSILTRLGPEVDALEHMQSDVRWMRLDCFLF